MASKIVIDTGNYYPASSGRAPDRSCLPIAGDSATAKTTEFLDSIGRGAVGVGPLANSWWQQPDTPVYGTFESEKGTPVGEDVIRAALAVVPRRPARNELPGDPGSRARGRVLANAEL